MPIIKTEAEARAYQAFRNLSAEFCVNLSDGFYQATRRISEAIRTIEPGSKETADAHAELADWFEREAESQVSGEQ